MTLLLAALAAVVSTAFWYNSSKRKEMKLGTLSLIYWGATLMWFVDAIVEYIELGAEFFTPEVADMLNDTYLGISVIVLGLIIWVVILLVKDPKGVVRATLFKKN